MCNAWAIYLQKLADRAQVSKDQVAHLMDLLLRQEKHDARAALFEDMLFDILLIDQLARRFIPHLYEEISDDIGLIL